MMIMGAGYNHSYLPFLSKIPMKRKTKKNSLKKEKITY